MIHGVVNAQRHELLVVLLDLRLGRALDLDDLHGEDEHPGNAAVVAIGEVGRDVHLPLVACNHSALAVKTSPSEKRSSVCKRAGAHLRP